MEPNKAQKKQPNFLKRLALFLLALAVALGAVAAVAFRDSLSLDSLRRWFQYRFLALNDSGQAESFRYDGDLGDCFAVLDGDLLVCSGNSISLYSGSGIQYVSESVTMSSPVVSINGSLAVVYDAGGSSLYILGQRSLLWSVENMDSILSARLNRNGQLTVVTQPSGYRSAVTVYDTTYIPVMSVNLSSTFAMDAALSDNGRTLSIVTVGQESGVFSTTLSLYSMDYANGSYTPDVTCPLGSSVILETKHTPSAVWTLGDQGLGITNHQGDTTTVAWSDRYLRRYALGGDGFSAVLLGRYRAGNQGELWVVDDTGAHRTLELNEQVLSISAAGRYLAVLTNNRLDIYTNQLELYASLEGTQGNRVVLLMNNGSAILISDGQAHFYVP